MTTLAVPGPPRPADTRPPGHPSAPPAPAPAPKPAALAYLWRDQWGRLAILAVATGTLGLATHYWTPALFLLALTARRRPGVRRRRNGAHRPQAHSPPGAPTAVPWLLRRQGSRRSGRRRSPGASHPDRTPGWPGF